MVVTTKKTSSSEEHSGMHVGNEWWQTSLIGFRKRSERLTKWRETCSCDLDKTECYCMQVSLQDFSGSQSTLLYFSWEANQES